MKIFSRSMKLKQNNGRLRDKYKSTYIMKLNDEMFINIFHKSIEKDSFSITPY